MTWERSTKRLIRLDIYQSEVKEVESVKNHRGQASTKTLNKLYCQTMGLPQQEIICNLL